MTAVETSPGGSGSSGDPARGRKRWWTFTIVGGLMMAVGLGFLGYVAWQYFGTNIVSKHKQAELRTGLQDEWQAPDKDEPWTSGDAFALIRIPRFGASYEMPVVKGVDDAALASGVGWFPETARPGQVGNFAVAGHRVTHGQPFHDFLELRKGDKVIVETRTKVFTYVLREDGDDRVLDFSKTWVLDPVPGKPGTEPTEAIITMVTCSELFHTDNRNVVFGDLVSTERK